MRFANALHTLLMFTLLLASTAAAGQTTARYRTQLAHPDASMRGATVAVTEHGSAEDAVRQYERLAAPSKIDGYRIRIFFDNSQNARAEALDIQSRFRSEFPGIPTFLVYENPSYIVTVGNCASIDEALMLWNKVKKSFNTAFLWRGELPVEELISTAAADNATNDPEQQNISTNPNISF